MCSPLPLAGEGLGVRAGAGSTTTSPPATGLWMPTVIEAKPLPIDTPALTPAPLPLAGEGRKQAGY
ncbi:protein of unknown function (plasmid) [Cupriavidus taiwanensis]|uniref:Uncharacterized protein n=1 Tax=Cupriavidus taiwanensis TaxID=164546 RepID=A0A375HFM8_9BURK|nr:hypothetical protein CBM2592_B100222 [Cupriavidus taiwanensis]SOY98008.1 hypothetical protein CBM2591_B80223 [Cupriavidus taiwanensis]SOZ31691.1 hypothetical protein CBM2608_B90072 [Cupriavidus taiwanensis]SOZ84928.1 hypothetical protein CBM2618_B120031 [Cupriavidus taiwanensis]SOZ88155.1 hypothetical protein CBM2622_B130030 [Cupriavidus taiwanensis]